MLKLFILLVVGYLVTTTIKRLLNIGQKETVPSTPIQQPSDEKIRSRIGRRLRRGAVAVMWLLLVGVVIKLALHALMAFHAAQVST